jgi:DNA-binding NarL/FixJ family response regulator
MIRVAVADDQALIRLGVRVLVEAEDDLAFVGEAADGRAAIELVRSTRPDVMLMDIRMPGMDGIEALQRIAADPAMAVTRVVMLTTAHEPHLHSLIVIRTGTRRFGPSLGASSTTSATSSSTTSATSSAEA